MNRLVFQLSGALDQYGNQQVQLALVEPDIYGSQAVPFTCTGHEPAFAGINGGAQAGNDVVRTAGRLLYDSLVSHPQLRQYLCTALQTVLPDRYPVFVKIATRDVEGLPWETLCSPDDDFLGLDERWAVGRIVSSIRNPLLQPLLFEPPLRLAAVLSCLRVDAGEEWRSLRAAAAGAGARGLGVEVLVVVSEAALYDQIHAEVQKGGPPGVQVQVELVPPVLADLQRLVSDFHPHILHFFCHGSAAGGGQLQLAIKSDWDIATSGSSLIVEAREIRAFTAPADDPPWLVLLNCCESAASPGQQPLQSLASKLVSDGGIPAVVGMREPVLSDDATVFTKALYERLFNELTTSSDARTQSLDWAQLVVQARMSLAKRRNGIALSDAAAKTKEWTLPVVYVCPAEFKLTVPSAGASARPRPSKRARHEIEALRRLLTQLPPDTTPPALLSDIESRIWTLTNGLGAES